MATVHIRDIMRWLAEAGQPDAQPWSGEFFLEIRFDESTVSLPVDAEMAGKAIVADTAQGTVTIVFDDNGQLRSLDIS
ncbi:MAG: hypothetical protein KKE65_05380 [Actinobacteria bacterium]|nr:hypothetical protein [Actinomycetota bacterium]MBU2111071.1 hypothetical protein [Actinomycetota bacterium]